MIDKNIPVPLTSFIGREREVVELQGLLLKARLVTVTGPGGSGKTRLALKAAHEITAAFSDGVQFVSLGAITDPTLILTTIAQVMDLGESPDRLLFDSLKDYLHDRHILLLLDNFEQLLPAAPLLTELLSAASQLKLLVTSREALRVRGEQLYPLAPLEVFSRELIPEQPSIEMLSNYASIRLLVDRARANQPGFELTSDNGAAIAEICARLDGLPLAIELAAGRINLLPPQAMLARLQESPLQLLTGGARDAPVRQRTLRDTIQWSYDLLSSDEQRAFRLLAVFTGGCTFEAAEVLLKSGSLGQGDSVFPPPDHLHGSALASPLDILTSLVDKNLVRRTGTDHEPRLEMLETIREFGLAQLAARHELEAAHQAHAHYFLALAEGSESRLTQPMSNQAAAVVIIPIALQTALQLGLNPRCFAMMIAVAASTSYLTPLEPACLMVYGPGRYRFGDFLRVGGLLTLVVFSLAITLIPVFGRCSEWSDHLPDRKTITRIEDI